MRCRDCGALNDANAIDCSECGLPLSAGREASAMSSPWIDKLPGWIRWVLALPVITLGGAVVVRVLLFAGINDSPGLIFPFAIAVAILAAAVSAARVAPVHGRYVGQAVAVADTLVFVTALLFESFDASPPPGLSIVLFATGGIAGTGAALFMLSRDGVAHRGGSTPTLLADLGPRANWSLGVLRSLFAPTALGAICALVAMLVPRYVPVGVSVDVGAVLTTAVTVAAFGAEAPTHKLLTSRIVAGIFCALGATSSVMTTIALVGMHDPEFIRSIYGFDALHNILQSIGLICGAMIGLDAASSSIKNEVRLGAT